MSERHIMIDTPEGIAFAQKCARKGALHLEIVGMRRRGQSVYSILKGAGYKGTRQQIYDQLQAEVDAVLGRRAQ